MEPMPLNTIAWIVLMAAAALVGVSKAGFGGGVGMLAVPLMMLVLKLIWLSM